MSWAFIGSLSSAYAGFVAIDVMCMNDQWLNDSNSASFWV